MGCYVVILEDRIHCQFCNHQLLKEFERDAARNMLIEDEAMGRNQYRFCPNCKRDLHEPNWGKVMDVKVQIAGVPEFYHTFGEGIPQDIHNVHSGSIEVRKLGENIDISWTSSEGGERASVYLRHEVAKAVAEAYYNEEPSPRP